MSKSDWVFIIPAALLLIFAFVNAFEESLAPFWATLLCAALGCGILLTNVGLNIYKLGKLNAKLESEKLLAELIKQSSHRRTAFLERVYEDIITTRHAAGSINDFYERQKTFVDQNSKMFEELVDDIRHEYFIKYNA